jgi:hypothetical protein
MKNKHVKSFNEMNENKNLNISDVMNSNFIGENWRDNDTITREMILNIIQTMSLDEAADEIYEMITEICRYR